MKAKSKSVGTATLMFAALVSFSLPIAAQSTIDFLSLPQTNRYLPIPAGYGGMSWGNLNYITTSLNGNPTNSGAPVFNSSAQTISAASPGQAFQLVSLTASGQNSFVLTVHGYNQGVHVGSRMYVLSPTPTVLNIPQSWGNVTLITLVCWTHFGNPAPYMLYRLALN